MAIRKPHNRTQDLGKDPGNGVVDAQAHWWGLSTCNGAGAKKQFWEFLFLLPSLHTMANQTLLAGLSYHIQRHNQKTRVDALWS